MGYEPMTILNRRLQNRPHTATSFQCTFLLVRAWVRTAVAAIFADIPPAYPELIEAYDVLSSLFNTIL